MTPEKIRLGQLLFHDPATHTDPKLDRNGRTTSCATCHHAAAGFRAGVAQSIGEGGLGFGSEGEGRRPDPWYEAYPDSVDVQPVRAPSALNLAFTDVVLWSGQAGDAEENEGTEYLWGPPIGVFNRLGFRGVETQAMAALSVHGLDEMGRLVSEVPEYRAFFEAAFPDEPEYRRHTRRNAGLAIGAYERTLLANRAPFQRWLRGEESALSEQEKRGAVLFFGKAGCVQCHNGPSLASTRFEALGMKDLVQTERATVATDTIMLQDTVARLGRGGFTQRREDMYRFRVPQLYNASDSRFYGHGASFSTVEEVVRYLNRAEPENPVVPADVLSPLFRPLNLTDDEIRAVTAFVANGLRDPDLERYVPEAVPSGRCFPNDDPVSRADLGCDSTKSADATDGSPADGR